MRKALWLRPEQRFHHASGAEKPGSTAFGRSGRELDVPVRAVTWTWSPAPVSQVPKGWGQAHG